MKTKMYSPVVISETEVKVVEIWRLFNRVQAVEDNKEYCSLELSDDGYGWIRHCEGDYLEFPCGSRNVMWDNFDRGIEVIKEYLQSVGE
jgi:hypothetical protein